MTKELYQEALAIHNPTYIIGADEVGWGCTAGPLVVGCAVYKPDFSHKDIKDSKKFSSEKARQKAFDLVKETAVYTDFEIMQPDEIHRLGAGPAIQKLYTTLLNRAIAKYTDSLIILDGKHLIKAVKHPQVAIIKADSYVPAVGAASIIAKVTRDNDMNTLALDYPEYSFEKNKGYFVPEHMEAVKIHGVTKHHRLNVGIIQEYLVKYGKYKNE